MAREDTFNESFIESKLNAKVEDQSLRSVAPRQVNRTELDLNNLPKKEEPKKEEPKKEAAPQEIARPFQPITIRKSVNRNFIIDEMVSEALDSIVTDKRTKKKLPGTKGLIKKIVSNALLKELVYMGVLDQSELDNLESY